MSWEFRSNENGRPMYFSQIRVDPSNPDIVYVVDQQVHKSMDGARTFEELDGFGHVDQHAFWINPADGDHLMIGNDGAVDVSYDGFYTAVDPTDHTVVYSESQNGNIRRLSLATGEQVSIRAEGAEREQSLVEHRSHAGPGHGDPLELEHALHPLAPQSRRSVRGRQTGCSGRWTGARRGR